MYSEAPMNPPLNAGNFFQERKQNAPATFVTGAFAENSTQLQIEDIGHRNAGRAAMRVKIVLSSGRIYCQGVDGTGRGGVAGRLDLQRARAGVQTARIQTQRARADPHPRDTERARTQTAPVLLRLQLPETSG